jgi:hypothetical protein
MSDQTPEQPKSIFEAAEEPEAGALRHDEAADAPPAEDLSHPERVSVEVPVGEHNPLDHSAEMKVKREYEESMGIAPPPLPTSQRIPVANPAMLPDATDDLKAEMERRFRAEFGPKEVQVTAEERSAFVRAALHDSELTFRVPVEGADVVVDVAIPSDKFTTLAAAACNQWIAGGHLEKDSDMQWLLAFQQIHAWYQVRAVDGVPTPWSIFWEETPSTAKIRTFMADPENFEVFFRMNAVRWRLFMDAIRTAEWKYKICLDNWNNRSFFTGADTA